MPLILRSARADEQQLIRDTIRSANLNPLDLQWQRFLIAEEDGRCVGMGQIRHHRDGTRELASLWVDEGRRALGIGALLTEALVRQAGLPTHLMCEGRMVPFYEKLRFRRIRRGLPRAFWAPVIIFGILTRIGRLFGRRSELAVMVREA